MSDADIARATGIPLPFIAGVRATESGGNPSALRFEPHLFKNYHPDAVRLLGSTSTDDERRDAWKADLVPYTHGKTRAASDSWLETGRDALKVAMAIDPSAGIRSTSLGSFQVLGGHLLALFPGKTPAIALAMFDVDSSSVSDRLLVQWLFSNHRALEAAKAGKVDLFISLYNGCAIDDTARYRARFDPAYVAAGGRL